jgi:hypothetical protein
MKSPYLRKLFEEKRLKEQALENWRTSDKGIRDLKLASIVREKAVKEQEEIKDA